MAEDRLALIVGATRGIGLGVAKEMLSRHWKVVATARDAGRAADLHELERTHPDRLSILPLDMADPASVDGFAKTLGGRTLDVALVNAGISGPDHRSASAATPEEIGALMFTNAIAPIRLARTLAGNMRRGTGVVAFTSSVMGSVALNSGGHELYRASKAALNSLTRGLWTELSGQDLTVLTLHPGWVKTDMGGSNAAVTVQDSAAGMVRELEKHGGTRAHRFVDYQGKELAW